MKIQIQKPLFAGIAWKHSIRPLSPLRLVVPGWEGNVNIKWLRRIKLGDKPWYSREETSNIPI